MARTVRDAKLDSRAARRRLPENNKQHWRSLHDGLHIGYRKGKRGGRWTARVYDPRKPGYVQEIIGIADDDSDADGIRVFSWPQAQEKARAIATVLAARVSGKSVGPYTVADAMEDYHRQLEREGKGSYDSRRRTDLYILPVLGDIRLEDLNADTLRDWLANMRDHPGYSRGGEERRKPEFETSEKAAEYQRRRRDSANRVLTMLKAGLNHAFNEGKVSNDAAWSPKRLKPFRSTSKARPDYLTKEEVRRLVNAAPAGFRELVQGALHTGARYGDLASMNVGDFNPDAGLIISANAKASRPTPTFLTDNAVAFFLRLCADRSASEPMFVHPTGSRWGKSQQARPMKQALEKAGIEVPITFHGLRHTYASHATMNGVPLLVIARNLGHRDTRMVEAHYGHLADGYLRDTLRQSGPQWGFDD